MKVKPRKGVELAGIPAAGADVPPELAEEWLRAKLVTRSDGRSARQAVKPSHQSPAPPRDKRGRLQPSGEA